MSLVGPRPELPHFVDTFKDEIPLYMVKHQVKPGITGLAQVNGYRGDTSIKKRIEYDIYYIENWSIFMEISILFKTVFKGIKNNEKLELKHKEISQDKAIKNRIYLSFNVCSINFRIYEIKIFHISIFII